MIKRMYVKDNNVVIVADHGIYTVPADRFAPDVYGNTSVIKITYREALESDRLVVREDELDNVDGTAYGALYVVPADDDEAMRVKTFNIAMTYMFHPGAADSVTAALMNCLAGDVAGAYAAVVYAVAKSEALFGPLSNASHPGGVTIRVDMDNMRAFAEYDGQTYRIELPEIVR